MIDLIERLDKGTRALWAGFAGLVLVFTFFIFMNDVYSTYWGLSDLSATYGVVVGVSPDSPWADAVNYALALGFSISALFLMALAGLIYVQIEILKKEDTEDSRAKAKSLENVRGKVLGLAIFFAILDFGTDVSYRFAEGAGFAQMWETPVYAEAIAISVAVGGVIAVLTYWVAHYDKITSFVVGVITGYINFIIFGYANGQDVTIFISFALSSIATIMVYTFANEVLFALSISYLMVALPLVIRDYELKNPFTFLRKNEEEVTRTSGLNGFSTTIVGLSGLDDDKPTPTHNRPNNMRGK